MTTYTSGLRLINQDTGANAATWGDNVDNALECLDDAITGIVTVDLTGSTSYTLTTNNNASDEARNALIYIKGIPSSANSVIIPAVEKLYDVRCVNTSIAGGITVRTNTGTGVNFTTSAVKRIYCDGVSVWSLTPLLTDSIQTGDITTTMISSSAITSAKIESGAVTEVKQTLADNTTWDVSTTRHGYVPKAPGSADKFLDGTGAWTVVNDSDLSLSDVTTNDVSTTRHGFVPKAPGSADKFLDGTGAWSIPAGKLTATTTVNATGVSATFTGIPNTATEVKVLFKGVSLDSGVADYFTLKVGTSSGTITTGYMAVGGQSGVVFYKSTTGFPIYNPVASEGVYGTLHLTKDGGNNWFCDFSYASFDGGSNGRATITGGYVALVSTLYTITVSVRSGYTFDAGSFVVVYR